MPHGSLSPTKLVIGGIVLATAMYCMHLRRRVSIVVRRAAFDIGSGYTKMLVADVKDGAIVGRIILETEVKLAFKVDAQKSADGSLSDAIQAEGLQRFQRLAAKAPWYPRLPNSALVLLPKTHTLTHTFNYHYI